MKYLSACSFDANANRKYEKLYNRVPTSKNKFPFWSGSTSKIFSIASINPSGFSLYRSANWKII